MFVWSDVGRQEEVRELLSAARGDGSEGIIVGAVLQGGCVRIDPLGRRFEQRSNPGWTCFLQGLSPLGFPLHFYLRLDSFLIQIPHSVMRQLHISMIHYYSVPCTPGYLP